MCNLILNKCFFFHECVSRISYGTYYQIGLIYSYTETLTNYRSLDQGIQLPADNCHLSFPEQSIQLYELW